MTRVPSMHGPAETKLDQPIRSVTAAGSGATAAPARMRARLTDLDRAKGMAILLVVFGHLVPQEDPAGVTWYDPVRIAIYLFHMPFFMYLSGYVTFWSGAAATPMARWPTLFGRRARRLLVPFFGFGCAILIGKIFARRFIHVDNVPQGFGAGLDSLFVHTAHSPATSVWYIGVLFVYVIATPLLLRVRLGGRLPAEAALLAAAFLLYVIPLPPILYMDRVGRFFIFFVVGGLAARGGQRWWSVLDRWYGPALMLLLMVLGLAASGVLHFNWGEDAADEAPYRATLLIAGLLSMVALHGLARTTLLARWTWLVFLGDLVFSIYLLNTICIGIAKGILLKFLHWNAQDFPLIASVMMLAGVLGPILIKRFILRHIPPLDRMTD